MKAFWVIWTVFGLANHCAHCALMWFHAAELFMDAHVPHIDATWHVISLLIGFVFLATERYSKHANTSAFVIGLHISNGVIALVQLIAGKGDHFALLVQSYGWRVVSIAVLIFATIALGFEIFALAKRLFNVRHR